MARSYPMLLFALLVLMVPVESAAGSGKLTGLREVRLEIKDLSRIEKELGLNEDSIKDHAFVLLRSKLPRLAVSESATSFVHVAPIIHFVTNQGGKKTGYYGFVLIRVFRRVMIVEIRKVTEVSVWEEIISIIGPLGSGHAATNVRESLNELLTNLAADWYRDNP